MEFPHLNHLIYVFQVPLGITTNEDKEELINGYLPHELKNSIARNLHNFYEECREYIEKNPNPDHLLKLFSDFQTKVSGVFYSNFTQEITDWDKRSRLYYVYSDLRHDIHYKDTLSIAVFNLAWAHKNAYKYLGEKIYSLRNKGKTKKTSKSRDKAILDDFKIKKDISRNAFRELQSLLENHSEPISLLNFKKIFTGQGVTTNIIWNENLIYLNKFIKGINGRAIEKINAGIWAVVCEIFRNREGNIIEEKQLKYPGTTTSEPIFGNIKLLIDDFNDIVERD
jgi:hypothetical protein